MLEKIFSHQANCEFFREMIKKTFFLNKAKCRARNSLIIANYVFLSFFSCCMNACDKRLEGYERAKKLMIMMHSLKLGSHFNCSVCATKNASSNKPCTKSFICFVSILWKCISTFAVLNWHKMQFPCVQLPHEKNECTTAFSWYF